ncbi:MAG: hypothetical protein CVV34_07120, partial [Methanomicrobiales archaeon HGW-Methanomicrobiales-5]
EEGCSRFKGCSRSRKDRSRSQERQPKAGIILIHISHIFIGFALFKNTAFTRAEGLLILRDKAPEYSREIIAGIPIPKSG